MSTETNAWTVTKLKGILHELNYDRVSVANSLQNVSISMSDFEQAKFYAQM